MRLSLSICLILCLFTASAFAEQFTVVAIPDTQGYPHHVNQPASNNLFIEEMQFIADNAAEMNIVFASHEGDVVMNSNHTQYQRAALAMNRLKNTIPFGMVPGNHDYDNTKPCEKSTLWNAYFGPNTSYFYGKSWYGGYAADGSDTDGMSSWQKFSAAGINFLHIGLEAVPSNARLNWAQSVINAHPGWPTIVTTHVWMTSASGTYMSSSVRDPYPRNNPTQMWNKFIKVNPQIFMLLCGHSFDYDYHCSYRRDDENNAGYPVHQLLADYQGTYSGSNLGHGGGWIRLMEFDPAANTIHVRTYSTIIDRYSSDRTLTDGSTYARRWAAFNYSSKGEGSLYSESHPKSSDFIIPFVYGRQLPYPAVSYGSHLTGLYKSFKIKSGIDWVISGLAYDPSVKLDGAYDRIYFLNRVNNGSEGLYSANVSQENAGPRLALGNVDGGDYPYGCAVDAEGNAYVCYSSSTRLWKVTDPSGPAPVEMLMLHNYETSTDDDLQSVSMVPRGFGGGFDEGSDLLLVDSGIDGNYYEGAVVVDSNSIAGNHLYSIIWKDNTDYFTDDIKGCASEFDGFLYVVPTSIPSAGIGGTVRPYICRVKADGIMQRIFLDKDITRDGAASYSDDSITVDPVSGSVWLATAASTSQGELYPRTVWRIDVKNAVHHAGTDFIAPVTEEITNLYVNTGVNGMAWSPDGRYLALGCVDTDKIFIYEAVLPKPVADAGDDQIVYAGANGKAGVELDGSGSDGFGYELSYKWTWSVNGTVFDANGVNPVIELPVGLHTITLTVNNGQTQSEPNDVQVTVIEPVECVASILPKALNVNKAAVYVRIHLPKSAEIDYSEPVVLYPGGAAAVKQWISCNDNFCILSAFFETDDFGESVSGESIEITVQGKLSTGEYFYGQNTVKLVP